MAHLIFKNLKGLLEPYNTLYFVWHLFPSSIPDKPIRGEDSMFVFILSLKHPRSHEFSWFKVFLIAFYIFIPII